VIDPQITDGPPPVTNVVLRQFAALSLLVFGGMAYWQRLHGRSTLALIFVALAVLIGPLGLVKPQAIRFVFVGITTIAFPLGWLISHMVLALLFFAVFTPVALLFKLIGRDALARHERPEVPTYWVAQPAVKDVRSYFRQS
jgi:hypothetical protein